MSAAPEVTFSEENVEHVKGPEKLWRALGTKKTVHPTAPAAAPTSSESAAVNGPDIIPVVDFDQSVFKETVTIVALRIPAKKCGIFQTHFRSNPSLLINRPRITTIIDGPCKDQKYLLLSASSIKELNSYPAATRALIKQEEVTPILFSFDLDYDYFTQDQILKKLLPSSIQIPAGFETVGHIAHLNLTDEQKPFGKIVARVILDKNPHLRTVVNKLGAIASEFRVFEMEVLAGVNSFDAEVREHNVVFRFDFSKVYWNSRLSTEHSRLMELFKPKQIIADLMCGIGPFVVPAAKRLGSQSKTFLNPINKLPIPYLWANDLNPDSFKALQGNIERNKINQITNGGLQPFNMDGRAFVWKLRSFQLTKTHPLYLQPLDHVVMNLPAIAIEFLDAFVGLYAKEGGEDGQEDAGEENLDDLSVGSVQEQLLRSTPIVHVYGFTRDVEEPARDLVPRIERALGNHAKLPNPVVVRDFSSTTQSLATKKKQQQQQQKSKDKPADGASTATPASSSSTSSSSSSTASLPTPNETHLRFVRNVAPNKDMYCVSFHMPREVLLATPSWRATQRKEAREGVTRPLRLEGTTAGPMSTGATASASSSSASSTAGNKRKEVDEAENKEENQEHPAKKSK